MKKLSALIVSFAIVLAGMGPGILAGTRPLSASATEVGEVVTTTDGTTETPYATPLNLDTGAAVRFTITEATPTTANTERMVFTFAKQNSENGVYLTAYLQYPNDSTEKMRRIRWDITWIRSAADHYTSECLYTYDNVVGDHSIDFVHMADSWFVTVDGFTFTPKREVHEMSLTDCRLTVSASSTAPLSYKVNSLDANIENIDHNGWAHLGDVKEVVQNDDGTYTFRNFNEKLTADEENTRGPLTQLDGNMQARSHLASLVGYDVDKPIEITFMHDNREASYGIWYGIGFEELPFDKIVTLRLNPDNTVMGGNVYQGFLTGTNDGIMFQTNGDCMAEASYANLPKVHYTDNSGGEPYTSGRYTLLNTLRIEIGETSTSVYMNGELLWDNYPLTRSHFATTHKVYPYFKFIETPATHLGGAVVVVKGINTPTAESNSFRRIKSETQPFTVAVDNKDNGTLTLEDENFAPVPASEYSYEGGILTVQPQVFASLEVGYHNFYVRNNGGYEMLRIRVVDSYRPLEAAELSATSYTFAEGKATEDLVISVNLKNGIFKEISGGTIRRREYFFNPEDDAPNGDHTATLTIYKSYLNRLTQGARVISLTTVNESDESESKTATITITVTGEGGSSTPSASHGGNGGTSSGGGSCSGSMAGAGLSAAAVFAVAALLKKRLG